MKKSFKLYLIAWAVLFILFNLLTFVVPSIPQNEKYTPSFWIGYTFITVTLVGQLICASTVFNSKSADKAFYNISLVRINLSATIVSFVVGAFFMVVSFLPYWIGIIICAVILSLNIISMIKAEAAIDLVTKTDKNIKANTFFIKSLVVDTKSLIERAETDEIKNECRKVYEAVRYSDPMSSESLASVESQITVKFNEFSEAVSISGGNVPELAKELIVLVGDRNEKCKLMK